MKPQAISRPDSCSTTETRVLNTDTDQMGVVCHATGLRWFEAGRAHCMRVRDCSYSSVERDGEELVRRFTRHAAVGRTGRIARLPEEVRAALLAPERNPGG